MTSKIKIITDPGSCHLGDLSKARELIKISAYSGADACKFQLFKRSTTNIPLPYDWFPELVSYGKELEIEVFASVFDKKSAHIVNSCCNSIKLAYSQQKNWKLIDEFLYLNNIKTFYISGDVMNWPIMGRYEKPIRLFCIPIYPVPYIIDFENIFEHFDGFSDHTLGIKQTLLAVKSGARFIEKHIQLDERCQVPDANFALIPKNLDIMVKEIRRIECTL